MIEGKKHTYGTVQSYKTSAHILRYQACDPKLEGDVVIPISSSVNSLQKEQHACSDRSVGWVKTLAVQRFIATQCFPSHMHKQ